MYDPSAPFAAPRPATAAASVLQLAEVTGVNPDGTYDVRFTRSRSARAGVPLLAGATPAVGDRVIVGHLDGDPQLPFIAATVAAELAALDSRLDALEAKTIPEVRHGRVTAGARASGSPFTVTTSTTGIYTVVYGTAMTGTPTVTCTSRTSGGARIPAVYSEGLTGFTVEWRNDFGALANADFGFYALL